ncbi:LysR family transcriptional regulator [Leucobacter sp. HY1908]
MLDVRKLTLLREVSLRGGVTAAATALNISPSAVSQQLARLEAETGVPLTVALGRGIQLTPAAHELVAHTEEVLAALETAEAALTRAREGLSGTVRIAAFHTFSIAALGESVRALTRMAPGLEVEFVELDPEQAVTELLARRADIALVDEYAGFPLPPTRGIVRSLVMHEKLVAYLPHAGANPAQVPWAAEPTSSDSFSWMRAVCRSAGFEPTVRFVSSDFHVHRLLVEQGLAAAFLPHSVTANLDPSLVIDLGAGEVLERALYTLVRRGTERSPVIAACQSAIAEATVGPITESRQVVGQ